MKKQWRSLSMLLAFVVGGVLHEPLSDMTWWLPVGIAFMITLSVLGLDAHRLAPRPLHGVLLLVWAALAAFFWGVPYLLGYPAVAEALFFCAAAPVAAAIPVIVLLLRGDVEFVTTAMVLSHLAYALLMPLVIPLVMSNAYMGYTEMLLLVARQLATVLMAPVLITLLLRTVCPKVKDLAHSPRVRDVSLLVWIFNLTIISATGTSRLIELEDAWRTMLPIAMGALIACATGFLVGYRLGFPRLKRECSQILGQKNTILTLYIATQHYASPLAIIGPVFYVFFHNFANAIQVLLADRERSRKASLSGK